MNIPTIKKINWNNYISDNIILLETSSFVSIMFSRNAVKNNGLPIKDFFIWLDDYEYTLRMTSNNYQGFLI
jgi:GT2 family glycosyltransferase